MTKIIYAVGQRNWNNDGWEVDPEIYECEWFEHKVAAEGCCDRLNARRRTEAHLAFVRRQANYRREQTEFNALVAAGLREPGSRDFTAALSQEFSFTPPYQIYEVEMN